MKKFTISFLLISAFAMAQVPPIGWQKTIGGAGSDNLSVIKRTNDNGYILGGTSSSNISGEKSENSKGLKDYWIVKTNAVGEMVWQRTIGGELNDKLSCLAVTSDGGYIVGGNSNSNISSDKSEICRGSDDYWVVKLDASGNIEWEKTIGGTGLEELRSIHQTDDGQYILCGSSNSNVSGEKTGNSNGGSDAWIVKVDGSGTIQWQKTYGGSGSEFNATLATVSDGSFIFGCQSFSVVSGDVATSMYAGYSPFTWIAKLDAAGDISWQKPYRMVEFGSVIATSDGGFVICGTSVDEFQPRNIVSYDDSACVIKLDSTGNHIWHNNIQNDDCYVADVVEATDGSFYSLTRTSPSSLAFVTKISASGSYQWHKTFLTSGSEYVAGIESTSDNSAIVGMSSTSNIYGDKTDNCRGLTDFWVVKFEPSALSDDNFLTQKFSVFPNPVNNQINIRSNEMANCDVYIFDVLGQEIQRQSFLNRSEMSINANFSSGMYYMKFIDRNAHRIQTIKICKQ